MAPRKQADHESTQIHLLSSSDWTLDHPDPQASFSSKSWVPQGWRFSVACGALLALVVFLLNFFTALYFSVRKNNEYKNTLFRGDCEKAKRLNTLVHLLINVLSTVLLSTSNYAMQCVTGPTREEIDVAHAERRWLDIGVLSVRNLRSIKRSRVVLWVILGFSSLPLHLLYNSAVYSVLVANDYDVFSATPSMLQEGLDALQPLGAVRDGKSRIKMDAYAHARDMLNMSSQGQLERLDNAACIKEYAKIFETERSHLILMFDAPGNLTQEPFHYSTWKATISQTRFQCNPDPHHWICGREGPDGCGKPRPPPCSALVGSIKPEEWKAFTKEPISYCLSAAKKSQCFLQFSPQIIWTVVAFNLIKVAVLAIIAFRLHHSPLLTFGDGVASFLSRRDDTTRGLCLMGKDSISEWMGPGQDRLGYWTFSLRRSRWRSAVSATRWWMCVSLYCTVLVVCFGLFVYGLTSGVAAPSQIMSIGLGEPNPRSIIKWSVPATGVKGLLSNVIVANIPQLILSGVYYTYNGVFTTFWLAQEGNEYALKRKGLRVSTAQRGAQRTSYFLQLPYRYGFPLIVVSGILHWLISQSLYLVVVVTSDEGEYISCGYSVKAILSVILIGLSMLCILVFLGRRHFSSSMPVAASCSASISAFCHLPEYGSDMYAATKRVKWGVTGMAQMGWQAPQIGHCSFSSDQVWEPQGGEKYAGLRSRLRSQ